MYDVYVKSNINAITEIEQPPCLCAMFISLHIRPSLCTQLILLKNSQHALPFPRPLVYSGKLRLGIYLTNCPKIAKKVKVYNNNSWKLASLNASEFTQNVASSSVHRGSHVPGYQIISESGLFHFPVETPDMNPQARSLVIDSYISFAPSELTFSKSLLYSNILYSSSKYNNCSGKVEIRYYILQEVFDADLEFPFVVPSGEIGQQHSFSS
ncbi:hypothetical protein MLD38_013993 [Melastoma candidum]|uniref:Uncharacterized protein n=1 Tax=Melastoma candidum TaxID=119954 RepID=A0ACB9REH3_9MYRT|nr:hypothetical protein MLD38_013993 [Melastoma candidum]